VECAQSLGLEAETALRWFPEDGEARRILAESHLEAEAAVLVKFELRKSAGDTTLAAVNLDRFQEAAGT
jgi:hypothetical protein